MWGGTPYISHLEGISTKCEVNGEKVRLTHLYIDNNQFFDIINLYYILVPT